MTITKESSVNTKYIDVLDGIRAISVIIVLIFHFWQQTWIFPRVNVPWLSFIGITRIDFTHWARVGYLFVDMMVLISGFLLFLPVARNIIFGENLQSWGAYFKKRVVRILPSYLLSVIALFIYESATGGFSSSDGVYNLGYAIKDLLSHLTFTQTLWVDTYISTKLNVVLWTVAIEVWFYILFPLIAMFTKRWKCSNEKACLHSIIKVIILALIMIGLSYLYIYGYAMDEGRYLSMVINQFPAFLGVYGVGILGALGYIAASKYIKRNLVVGTVSTVCSVFFIYLIAKLVESCSLSDAPQIWQMTERLNLSITFMGFILFTAYSVKWYRFIFSNRFMRYLSAISFNLYIWHQWLAVKLKYDWRIPYWEGATPPNQLSNREWMSEYALIITVIAFVSATLVTYLFERPITDLLNRRPSIYNGKVKIMLATRKHDK